MTVKAGIVCGNCDQLNPMSNRECVECGNELSFIVSKLTDKSQLNERLKPDSHKADQKEIEEDPMEQARHYVCASCYSPVPGGHKFCGKCGTLADAADPNAKFFGDLQAPGKAKLILIRGEGMDGMSYHLNSTEHTAGRSLGPILFAEDKWLSPKHANFLYENGKLKVRDENSENGIFYSVTDTIDVASGVVFMAGEQVFRIDEVKPFDDDPEKDGTYFFASPKPEASFRVVQILEGGGDGLAVHAKNGTLLIGRENSDMNFPHDPYISGSHVKIEIMQGVLKLTDENSKNGTFVRILGEHGLSHGDYLFLGRQLLRVEITN